MSRPFPSLHTASCHVLVFTDAAPCIRKISLREWARTRSQSRTHLAGFEPFWRTLIPRIWVVTIMSDNPTDESLLSLRVVVKQ